MSSRIVPLFCLLTAAASSVHAADPVHSRQAASAETEQRLRQDVQLMLSRLAASGALGQNPEQIDLRLDEPAQRVTNLGILVDSTSAEHARDGLRVLGATPGSTAENLGLRPGDVIVAVNDTPLRDLGSDANGHALAAATLKASVDGLPDSAPLHLQVMRAGDMLALNAPLQSVTLPALRMELGAAALAGTDPAAITKILDQVGLTPQRHALTGNLSSGQRTRVSLAAALVGDPELFLLDEPTVGLDPVLRRDLWDLFARVAAGGASLLVSSHVMDEAARCDRLLLMRDGRLLADETLPALLARTGAPDVEHAFLTLVEAGVP